MKKLPDNSTSQFQTKWLKGMLPTIETLIANPAHKHYKSLSNVLRNDITALRERVYIENKEVFKRVVDRFQILELSSCFWR
jgi:hypothetical protein